MTKNLLDEMTEIAQATGQYDMTTDREKMIGKIEPIIARVARRGLYSHDCMETIINAVLDEVGNTEILSMLDNLLYFDTVPDDYKLLIKTLIEQLKDKDK